MCDNGEKLFKLSPAQLLRALDETRQTFSIDGDKELLWGGYRLKVFVNGQLATSELLRIETPTSSNGSSSLGAVGGARLDFAKEWAGCVRALEYRGVWVDPGLKSAMASLQPHIEGAFHFLDKRRGAYDEEDGASDRAVDSSASAHTAQPTAVDTTTAGGAAAPERGEENEGECASTGGATTAAGAGRAAELVMAAFSSSRTEAGCGSICRGSTLMNMANEESLGMQITMEDWWELSKACKFTQSGDRTGGSACLTQAKLDELIPSHAIKTRKQRGRTAMLGASFDGGVGASAEHFGLVQSFSFATLLEALVMVAVEKFKGLPTGIAVERLFAGDVLKNIKSPPLDPIRNELRHGADCRLLVRHKAKLLREIYSYWARADEREARADLLSCKEATCMLQKAAIIGQRVSIVHVRSLLMTTLFEQRSGNYNADHDDMHLVFGDFVELLARAADAYFRGSKSVPSLADKMALIIEHVHLSLVESGQLAPPKEPRRAVVARSPTRKQSLK